MSKADEQNERIHQAREATVARLSLSLGLPPARVKEFLERAIERIASRAEDYMDKGSNERQ
jgi:hypothetical protein